MDWYWSREAAPEPLQSRVPLLWPPALACRPPASPLSTFPPPCAPNTSPPAFLPPPPSPPLQWGQTPLHWAARAGHTHVVALLLMSPGVDPLSRDSVVRGALRGLRGPTACPMPLPSAAGWRDSARVGAGQWKGRHSLAAAGGPARRSGSRQALSRGRRLGPHAGGDDAAHPSRLHCRPIWHAAQGDELRLP